METKIIYCDWCKSEIGVDSIYFIISRAHDDIINKKKHICINCVKVGNKAIKKKTKLDKKKLKP